MRHRAPNQGIRNRASISIILAAAIAACCWAGSGHAPPGAPAQTQPAAPATQPAPKPATQPATQPAAKTVQVRTAEEFVAAIGSDRIVQLAPGEYSLTAVKQRKMDHVLWREQHDGYDICIRNVKDLRIEGQGPKKVRVLVSPRYAYVLAFRNVTGLSLANLELGHGPEKGYCTGGVVELAGCRDVSIADCVLFGCGTEGLTLQDTTGMDFRRSTIRDCSYGILTAQGCKRLTFQDSAFTGNREFHGFLLSDCEGVAFRNCRIENNSLTSLNYPLFSATSCSKVTVTGGTIRNNVYKRLMQPDDSVEIKDITLDNNTPPK